MVRGPWITKYEPSIYIEFALPHLEKRGVEIYVPVLKTRSGISRLSTLGTTTTPFGHRDGP